MLPVVSALLWIFSKGGSDVAQNPKNEDQEQITGENVVGKAAGEDAEFEEVDEFDEDDDQAEGEEVEED
jgi:hypothetical protein